MKMPAKRKILILSLTITLFFSLLPMALPQSTPVPGPEAKPSPAPVIEFKETNYDTGSVWEGSAASHTFTFTNTGNALLRINKVRTSCGCTAAVLSSTEIPPGQSGEIKATFNTRRYAGKQSKTIYVSSNDPAHPTVQLRLETTIKSAGTFSPRNLQFGSVPLGQGATRTIKLVPGDGPIDITGISASPEIFQARIIAGEQTNRETAAPDKKALPIEIEVTVSPDAPIGNHQGTLTVSLNHPHTSSLSARLFVKIEGPVQYSPRMLFFNQEDQEKKIAKTIRITNTSKKDLTILKTESTAPEFLVKVINLQHGREFDLEISPGPDVAPGRYTGEIIVKTDSPGQEEIRIPIRSNAGK